MKLALYGATGTIGSRIFAEALLRGHEVTAIVRDPSRITRSDDNLAVVIGDIFDTGSIGTATSGQDIIISAYGPPPESPRDIINATLALIAGASQGGVPRLIAVGGASSLEVAPGIKVIDTPDFPEAWKPVAQAHTEALNLYNGAPDELDWEVFSPAAFIEPGERTGSYRTNTDNLVMDENGVSRISAEDYAVALLDEVENQQFSRQRFTAGY